MAGMDTAEAVAPAAPASPPPSAPAAACRAVLYAPPSAQFFASPSSSAFFT
ncbi:hypothetical protein L195_g064282, partial [Trifolium pratense]